MVNQATAETSSIFTLGSIRGRMKEKRDRSIKLNASLASKIKTKIINNSSIFKISLKHNNKALALALTVEKENTRRLKNEKIFLQREVEELHFHNVLLRQKLNCLNKTLIEIEAFMNNNLLTAIEMSSFSEHLQNPLPLSSGQSSCADHQSKTSYHSVRTVGMPMKVPLIAAHNAKQQDSSSVCEKSDDLCNLISVVSNEVCAGQISVELLLENEKNKQKSKEIDKMETVFDSNIFFRENQPCTQLSSNNALVSDLDNVPSVGQSEALTKPHDSPLPFCGNVTERKQHAISCRSNTHAGIVDFNKKVTPSNGSHWSIDKGNNINEMKPNVLSHPGSSLQPRNEFKTDSNEVHFGNQLKPEETVYDTDMELTASDVGKILTITSKAKNKMNSNAKSDQISANLRKVRYSSTGKKDKEKIKNNPKGSSDFHSEKRHKNTENSIDSNNSESNAPKFQLEAEQVAEGNALGELTLQRANKDGDVQNSQYNDKATRRTYLVNLASPSKQQKPDYLQQKINKRTLSKRLENMDNKFQNPDYRSSNNKAPSKDYCTKSLPCIESHISSVLSLQQDLLDVNEKHIKPKRNSKAFQIPSKISKTNHCRKEIGEHSESSSKRPGAKACKPDCKTKQDQKNNIKSECHKENNYSDRRKTQTSSHYVGIKKIDRKSNEVSLGSSKSVLAKGSRKTNIQPGDFTQCTLSVKQELKNEDMLDIEIVHGNNTTKTQETQGILDSPSSITINKQWTRSSLKKVDEYNVNILKKGVGPISKANKKTCIVISPDDHIKSSERLISEFSETRLEECDIRQIDQMEQNILGGQKVRTERDPFMNKLINKSALVNIMIEEPCLLKFSSVTCSKEMPFNSCSFLQEGLPHMELSAVDYHKISENFPMLKNSEIFEKTNFEKVLCANRANKKMETAFKGSCPKPSGTGSDTKALQDMTNTSLYSHTSLLKLQNVLKENSTPPVRRRRATVCYKEPKISSKLRRGDQFTDMEFFNSPVFKVKNKRSFKSKSRLI